MFFIVKSLFLITYLLLLNLQLIVNYSFAILRCLKLYYLTNCQKTIVKHKK